MKECNHWKSNQNTDPTATIYGIQGRNIRTIVTICILNSLFDGILDNILQFKPLSLWEIKDTLKRTAFQVINSTTLLVTNISGMGGGRRK